MLDAPQAPMTPKKKLEVITQAVGDCSQTLRRLLDFSRRNATARLHPSTLANSLRRVWKSLVPKWQAESGRKLARIDVRGRCARTSNGDGRLFRVTRSCPESNLQAVDAMTQGGVIEIGYWCRGSVREVLGGRQRRRHDARSRRPYLEPFYSTKGERGNRSGTLGLSRHHWKTTAAISK